MKHEMLAKSEEISVETELKFGGFLNRTDLGGHRFLLRGTQALPSNYHLSAAETETGVKSG